jgi:DNA invertase Pin-like site-specific DNA recombinase
MLIGYMRVSKADGSQATDLQRDALIAAGVDPAHLYGSSVGQTRGSSRPVELPEGATTGGYVDGVET